MTVQASTWLARRKWILAAVGLSVLVALWWAFRPEKLWINEKVNEAAPFATSGGDGHVVLARSGDQSLAQDTGKGDLDSRHFFPEENPDDTAALVKKFLAA